MRGLCKSCDHEVRGPSLGPHFRNPFGNSGGGWSREADAGQELGRWVSNMGGRQRPKKLLLTLGGALLSRSL